MVNLLKKLSTGVLLILLLWVFVNFFAITPFWHYYIGKDERLNLIENLQHNCLSEDVTYLIITYKDLYLDKNTSKCWKKYFRTCFFNKDHNLTLDIPIKCKIY